MDNPKITSAVASEKLNIAGMVNQNRADLAYNIIDVEGKATDSLVEKLNAIDGVLGVRVIEG